MSSKCELCKWCYRNTSMDIGDEICVNRKSENFREFTILVDMCDDGEYVGD